MAPRPFEIFQKSSPSVCFWTAADVQFAGFGGGSAAAAGPSPFPMGPRHDTQFVSTDFFAFPTPFTGFFVALASAGATHGPWAETTATPVQTTSVIAATAMLSDLPNALMAPPLVKPVPAHTIVMMFRKRKPFNTPGTNEVKQIFDARASRRASRA